MSNQQGVADQFQPLFTLSHSREGSAIDQPAVSDDGPVVYVLQKPSSPRDLSSLTKFGRVQFIFDYTIAPSTDIPKYQSLVTEFLNDNFYPESDFIAMAGGDPFTGILIGAAMQRLFPEDDIKYLRWRRFTTKDDVGSKITMAEYVPADKFTLYLDVPR